MTLIVSLSLSHIHTHTLALSPPNFLLSLMPTNYLSPWSSPLSFTEALFPRQLISPVFLVPQSRQLALALAVISQMARESSVLPYFAFSSSVP